MVVALVMLNGMLNVFATATKISACAVAADGLVISKALMYSTKMNTATIPADPVVVSSTDEDRLVSTTSPICALEKPPRVCTAAVVVTMVDNAALFVTCMPTS